MDALQMKISELFSAIVENFMAIVPKIAVVMIFVILGWFVAKLLKYWAIKIMDPLFAWIQNHIEKSNHHSTELNRKAPLIAGRLIFWITWLFFSIGAIQFVAKSIAATGFDLFIQFLPQLLAAVLIFFGGWIFGVVVQGITSKSLSAHDSERARALGHLAKNIILFLTLVIVVDQLGFRVDLIIQLSIILAASIAGSFALAFSFGAKSIIADIMASYYILKSFKVGQRIKIGDLDGKILNIARTQVVLDTSSGLVFIPTHDFHDQWVSVLKEL
jgi:hypothetical protein